MAIRPLTPPDMGQARALWEACFEDLPAFLDWYFQTRFQPADGLGIFQDGQLVCDLHLSPRRIKLRQQSFPSAYLIALATDPPFAGWDWQNTPDLRPPPPGRQGDLLHLFAPL